MDGGGRGSSPRNTKANGVVAQLPARNAPIRYGQPAACSPGGFGPTAPSHGTQEGAGGEGVDLALNRDPGTSGSMAAVGLALAGAVLGRCAAPGDVAWSGGAPPSRPNSSLAEPVPDRGGGGEGGV